MGVACSGSRCDQYQTQLTPMAVGWVVSSEEIVGDACMAPGVMGSLWPMELASLSLRDEYEIVGMFNSLGHMEGG